MAAHAGRIHLYTTARRLAILLAALVTAGCATPPPLIPVEEPPAVAVAPPEPPVPAAVVVPPSDTSLATNPVETPAAPREFVPMKTGESRHWLAWQERKRNFLLHVPPGYDGKTPLPLVLVLHARGSSAQAARMLGFSRKADTAKFFVVYPEALGAARAWSAVFDRSRDKPAAEIDDTGYLEALIGTVRQSVNIDPRRIYLVGQSSGGMMAYQLAGAAAHLVAGVATVGATIGSRDREGNVVRIDAPSRAVPVMHVHGALDKTVPFKGGRSATLPGMDYLGAGETVEFWAAANRCFGGPRSNRVGPVLLEIYDDCEAGATVEFVTIVRGGAEWPRTLRTDAARTPSIVDTIWDFFAAHPRKS